MEFQTTTMVAVFVACMLLIPSLAIPISSSEEGTSLSAEKRPKYMETRDLSIFKNFLLFALDELIDEGKVSPKVLIASKDTAVDNKMEKRGPRLGICVRVTPSGSYIPTACWRREGKMGR